ncbi:MAG: AMP-binding protein [Anaerolineaceae bacterium]|nr:AMP-binding protein [Anaerolineaceae bacterium]
MMLSKEFSTLIEMLEFRAGRNGDAVAFTFQKQACTYAEMWESINHFGAYLQQSGISHGDRVVLVLPNSAEFFAAFYGVQRMGGIAVPLFPGSGPERIFSIARSCEASTIVAPSTLPEEQIAGYKKMGRDWGFQVVTVSESANTSSMTAFPEVQPDDISFIQYTSGSTGNSKGVQLSHDNLVTNIVQLIISMEITKDDIFVSWLPVYHDMGLILMTMVPFYLGSVVHLLPTDLRNVHHWLDAIQKHGGTFTAAPDFAYRICLRHTEPNDYDLSSLRVALNAAEPIRARTILDFESAYRLEGVMIAAYGLAEATVGVSTWRPGSRPRIDEGGIVSVGSPFPDIVVKISGDDGLLPPGEVGEIIIDSTANSRGYFRNPEETQRLFTEDGYLLSGDLGYMDEDGNLYFVSRKKNIIKRSGETISPHEIEEIVDQTSAVRYSAAVGVDQDRLEGEQVYIFAEIRDGETKSENELYELVLEIVNAVHSRMGFRPGRVLLLKQHTIPMTYNGKIQHARLKEKYLDGSLRHSRNILYPEY